MKIIATRDLYKRQQELQDELDTLLDEIADLKDLKEELDDQYAEEENQKYIDDLTARLEECIEEIEAVEQALAEWQEENQEELDELNTLENQIGEWRYGAALIPEDDFTEYVQDMAEDVGAVGESSSWIVIDWEATADGVKMDYSTCEYQGETYYFRA